MWTIILTTFIVTNGNHVEAKPVLSVITVGSYKTAATCLRYANALTKIQLVTGNTLFIKDVSAVCVKVED